MHVLYTEKSTGIPDAHLELTRLSNGQNVQKLTMSVLHPSELTRLSNYMRSSSDTHEVLHPSELTRLSNNDFRLSPRQKFYTHLN